MVDVFFSPTTGCELYTHDIFNTTGHIVHASVLNGLTFREYSQGFLQQQKCPGFSFI